VPDLRTENREAPDVATDIRAVQSISAVPTILRVVAETTGLGFVCVARVDQDSWTACAVLDQLGFGLKPGDTLDLATTLCNEVRSGDSLIVIDDVSGDPVYCDHHTPKMYGFQSYFSVPVYRSSGEFFGTLCGLDPSPKQLSNPKTVDALVLFADLISRQLEDERRLSESEAALLSERENSELREQFIAVLGHDLRTPLLSILTGTDLLGMMPLDAKAQSVVDRIKRSARRISSLVDDVVDFTRGRMGDGVPLNAVETTDLGQQLQHVVAELRDVHPGRAIISEISFDGPVFCDPKRIAQMLSNLLVNALIYGAPDQPVRVSADGDEAGMSMAVSNGGKPLGAETISQLFRPFWRGSASNTAGGLGLGLYISSEIAKSHGGVLSVESNDAATTFRFEMPRIERG
jgi:signal transduction histidine kinase